MESDWIPWCFFQLSAHCLSSSNCPPSPMLQCHLCFCSLGFSWRAVLFLWPPAPQDSICCEIAPTSNGFLSLFICVAAAAAMVAAIHKLSKKVSWSWVFSILQFWNSFFMEFSMREDIDWNHITHGKGTEVSQSYPHPKVTPTWSKSREGS